MNTLGAHTLVSLGPTLKALLLTEPKVIHERHHHRHLVPRRWRTNWPVALLSVPPPKSKHATRRLWKVVLQLEDLERHKGRQQFSGRTGPRPSNTTKSFLHFASRLKSSPQQTSSLRPPTNFFLMKMHVMATNSVSSHEGRSVDKQWLFECDLKRRIRVKWEGLQFPWWTFWCVLQKVIFSVQRRKAIADWQIQRINAMATSSYWQCTSKVDVRTEPQSVIDHTRGKKMCIKSRTEQGSIHNPLSCHRSRAHNQHKMRFAES